MNVKYWEKKSITEVGEDEGIQMVLESRERRVNWIDIKKERAKRKAAKKKAEQGEKKKEVTAKEIDKVTDEMQRKMSQEELKKWLREAWKNVAEKSLC